jgi:hypothetical protein
MDQIIHVFVSFCMVLNPTMCRELEIVPLGADNMPYPASNIVECMRGVMSRPQVEFDMEGARWTVKGGRCEVVAAPIAQTQARLRSSVR